MRIIYTHNIKSILQLYGRSTPAACTVFCPPRLCSHPSLLRTGGAPSLLQYSPSIWTERYGCKWRHHISCRPGISPHLILPLPSRTTRLRLRRFEDRIARLRRPVVRRRLRRHILPLPREGCQRWQRHHRWQENRQRTMGHPHLFRFPSPIYTSTTPSTVDTTPILPLCQP